MRLGFLACLLFSLFFSSLHAREKGTVEKRFVLFDFRGEMASEDMQRLLMKNLKLSPCDLKLASLSFEEARKSGKTEEEFLREYTSSQGIVLPQPWHSRYERAKLTGFQLLLSVANLLFTLKEQGYGIAVLARADSKDLRHLQKKQISRFFKPTILSCEENEELSLENAFKALHIQPSQCLVIDAREERIWAADSLGADTILFESPELLEQEVEKRRR